MSKQRQRIESKPSDEGAIELCCFDKPKRQRHFSRKIAVNQADELERLWVDVRPLSR